MNELNERFFIEYKHLDKLLSEIYQNGQGITSYINDMESVSKNRVEKIACWQSDLRNLKALRYKRNQIAHDMDSFEKALANEEDICWIGNFFNRIMAQSDPIAILMREEKKKQVSRHTARNHNEQHRTSSVKVANGSRVYEKWISSEKKRKNQSNLYTCGTIAGITLILFVVMVLLMMICFMR